MMRTQIGMIAIVLLLSAALRYWTIGNLHDAVLGGLLRIGLVMGAFWLAMPQFTAIFAKTPRWLLIALAASVVVFALRPQLLWWLPVGAFAVWFAWSRLMPMFKPRTTIVTPSPRRPRRKG